MDNVNVKEAFLLSIFAKIHTIHLSDFLYLASGNGNYTETKMWHDFSFKSMFEVSLYITLQDLQIISMMNLGFEVQTFHWTTSTCWERRADHNCTHGYDIIHTVTQI